MNLEDDLEGLPLDPKGRAAVQGWIGRVPPSLIRVVGALAAIAAVRSGLGRSYYASAAEAVVSGFALLMRLDQIKTKAERRGIRHSNPMDPLPGLDEPWDQ